MLRTYLNTSGCSVPFGVGRVEKSLKLSQDIKRIGDYSWSFSKMQCSFGLLIGEISTHEPKNPVTFFTEI